MADTALRLVLFFDFPKKNTHTQNKTVFFAPFLSLSVFIPFYFLLDVCALMFSLHLYSFIFIRSVPFYLLYQCVYSHFFVVVVVTVIVTVWLLLLLPLGLLSVLVCVSVFLLLSVFLQNAFDFRTSIWMSYEYNVLFIRLFAFRIWITQQKEESVWERRQHHVA